MKLSQLLKGVPLQIGHLGQDVEITSLSCDTRTLKPGGLFVAYPGSKGDGRDYLRQALEKGAAAVVCQQPPPEEGPWLVVENGRTAFAQAAVNWFDNPAAGMTLIGVTGTNGKTTTTYLLKTMLEQAMGAKVGLIGTNQNMIGEEVLPAQRTTPDAYTLQSLLRQMADKGCTHVVMEVSSHALALHRTDGLRFRAGIFTNLTQDHLDFHGTMEAYRGAKGKLFDQCQAAILNLDDEAGRWYAKQVPCKVVTYSENKAEADLQAKNIRLRADRVEFEALTLGSISRVRLPIPGGFSIYNALGVLACGLELGGNLTQLAAALADAPGVKGRVEVVPTPADYTVIIDYAHTPDALEKLLLSVREFTPGRLICLFGCGGDRDRSKRPLMGAIAGELADIVVLTSDNPRTEPPAVILDEIQGGLPAAGATVYREEDRRRAIQLALELGRTGDVIVLAGKGHETYQEIGEDRFHLDEREEIAACFQTA